MSDSDPVGGIVPPDDSGSATFERFHYQAEVCLTFCVQCALGTADIIAIIAEHIEDVVLQTVTGWRFLQIKTRNAELGPWRLSHLYEDSGALHSLLRTFNILKGMGITFTLEAHLEGALAKDDPINELTVTGTLSNETRDKLASKLSLTKDDCDDFLSHVTVCGKLPQREVISYCNRSLLSDALNCSSEQTNRCHTDLVMMVHNAMMAKHGIVEWQLQALSMSGDKVTEERYACKLIPRADLQKVIVKGPSTTNERRLYERMIDTSRPFPSKLESKLILGGARDQIIEEALNRRAATSTHKARKGYGSLLDKLARGTPKKLEALDDTLCSRVRALGSVLTGASDPANRIWLDLQRELQSNATALDPNGILGRDPLLLLGEACELSDECKVRWDYGK